MVVSTARRVVRPLCLLALATFAACAQGSRSGGTGGASGGGGSVPDAGDAISGKSGSGGETGAGGNTGSGEGAGNGGGPGAGGADAGAADAVDDLASDRAAADGSGGDVGVDNPSCLSGSRGPLRLVTVVMARRPIHLVGHPSEPDTILLAERDGAIRTIKGSTLGATPVVTVQTKTDGERGLLSLALHPDDATRLFAFYTAADNDDSVVQEFARAGDAAAPTRVQYRHPHSSLYRQGGSIAFGADKMLYIAVGDNGADGGPTVAQQIGSRHGKILRVDPATGMAAAGNPSGFTWSFGLRNPWRIAFDRLTGDLYIADVGEDHEEVNFEPRGVAGRNYAWGGNGTTGEALRYGRSCIVGGHVYRGKKLRCMQGRYIFKDRLSGVAQSFAIQNGRASDARQHPQLAGAGLYSFGEDGNGELYMLFEDGRVARIEAD